MHEIRLGRQEDHVSAKLVTSHGDIRSLDDLLGLRCLVIRVGDNNKQPTYEIHKSSNAPTWLFVAESTEPVEGCKKLVQITPPVEQIESNIRAIRNIFLLSNTAKVFYHHDHKYGIIIEGEPCESDDLPIRKTIVAP